LSAIGAADLSGAQLRTLVKLWEATDDSGVICTTRDELARAVGAQPRNTTIAIGAIVETGLLERLGSGFVFRWQTERLKELGAGAKAKGKPVTRNRIFGVDADQVVAALLDGLSRGASRTYAKGTKITRPAADVIAFALERIQVYAATHKKLADVVHVARVYGDSYYRCRMPVDRHTGKPAMHPLTPGFLANATTELDVYVPEQLRAERDRVVVDLEEKRRQRDDYFDGIDAREQHARGAQNVVRAAGGAR
jgi:hypothetical protein